MTLPQEKLAGSMKRHSESRPKRRAGALAPLRHRAFALVWMSTLLGNIALWMRDVASGWLMTTLDPRPGMVALIQAASYLPVAIFVLPGVLADVFDRRSVIVASQLLLCAVGILLGVLTHFGVSHPWGLIALCLVGGVIAAFAQPAWQAILPEVLPIDELPRGMALYNLGFNIARVRIGPAAAGAIIAASGIVGAYAANVSCCSSSVPSSWCRGSIHRCAPRSAPSR